MITNKVKIKEELTINVGRVCLFDIHKENQFTFGAVGKLSWDGSVSETGFYQIKDFCFFLDSIDNVEYFGIMLRIQLRP